MAPTTKQIFFLSGLPRTGSTLLTSILSENPKIHDEGNSAVCQLMWDIKVSCESDASQQLKANNRDNTKKDIISKIPEIYYANTNKPFIVDKCRSWTLPANINLIKDFITDKPKIIVMIRPLREIVESFIYINSINKVNFNVEQLLAKDSEPLMRSLEGVKFAIEQKNDDFIFIKYKDLVEQPEKTIKNIYNFCGIEQYNHNYTNIVNKNPENDNIYDLVGFHDVRSTINYREKNIKLPKNIEKQIEQLDYNLNILLHDNLNNSYIS
jgi:sulfotransferase